MSDWTTYQTPYWDPKSGSINPCVLSPGLHFQLAETTRLAAPSCGTSQLDSPDHPDPAPTLSGTAAHLPSSILDTTTGAWGSLVPDTNIPASLVTIELLLEDNQGGLAALPEPPDSTCFPELLGGNDSYQISLGLGPTNQDGFGVWGGSSSSQFSSSISSMSPESYNLSPVTAPSPALLIVCDVCGKTWKSKSELNKHKIHHYKRVECPICHKKVATSRDLERHESSNHTSKSARRLFPCSIRTCAKSFTRQDNMKRHFDKYHSDRGIPSSPRSGIRALSGH